MDLITIGLTKKSPMSKYLLDLCVQAPQYLSDGTLIFCEHGQSPDENILNWQNRINPYWRKVAGGCNLNKNIPEILKQNKFQIENLETMYLTSTPKFFGFNYLGSATLI